MNRSNTKKDVHDGATKDKVDCGKVFYDANNVACVPQANGAQLQEVVDMNFLIEKQFESQKHKVARLGTASMNYTYEQFLNNTVNDPNMSMLSESDVFDVNIFAGLDARVLKLQNTRAMESEENFRLVCTWAWNYTNENKVNLSWFLPFNSSVKKLESVGELAMALQEFETFMCITFGEVWGRCTLDLQEDLQRNVKLLAGGLSAF
jgi:hypothetical protein